MIGKQGSLRSPREFEVQNLIERCLQLYMSQREVVSILLEHATIEPGFTELVWQKLEAENQEFFRAYHLRLIVKDQIVRFNQLINRQVQLMREMNQTGVAPIPLFKGTQVRSMCVQGPVNLQDHTGKVDVLRNMGITQNSNPGIMRRTNGISVKPEGDYPANSSFIFGTENNIPELRNAIGDGSVCSFSGGESSSQTLNENMFNPEANTFGFLGQIPRNFSLSDLTADFSNNIMETYSRSPFLGTQANFLDPHYRGEKQDTKGLDTISEGLNYGID